MNLMSDGCIKYGNTFAGSSVPQPAAYFKVYDIPTFDIDKPCSIQIKKERYNSFHVKSIPIAVLGVSQLCKR